MVGLGFTRDFGRYRPGKIVRTKTGVIGRTYSDEELVNGKIRVYTDKGNLLCDPATIKVIGFID